MDLKIIFCLLCASVIVYVTVQLNTKTDNQATNHVKNVPRHRGYEENETQPYYGHTTAEALVSTNISHSPVKSNANNQTMRYTLEQIRGKCQNVSSLSYWKTMKPHGTVWHYGKLNLHYCIVPKVGCTYWKRIIRFESHDYPSHRNIRKPSDIDRYSVHNNPHPHIQEYNMKDEEKRINMTNRAFMFTRDPYARLWSAYLDKFFLPDFWRRAKTLLKLSNQNLTENELNCGSALSFVGFLTAITKIWPKALNDHWEPIHLLCSPCHVNYAATGKMEHFTADANYILAMFGIHLNNTMSKLELMFEEITTLARYNFELDKLMSANCFNKADIAQRLWKTFQYNGYIDRLTPFPSEEFDDSNFTSHSTQTFLEIAKRTIDRQTKDISSQRRGMMLEAYKEVPKLLLDKIKTIYRYDFELFGYEKDLFK